MRFFKALLILLMLVGCGSDIETSPTGPKGDPGPKGSKGEPAPLPPEVEEGLEAALSCMDEALPDYELKSATVNETNGDINIKYKEIAP